MYTFLDVTSCGLVDKTGFDGKWCPIFLYLVCVTARVIDFIFLSFTLTQQSLFDDPRFKLSNKESEIFSVLHCAVSADITDYIK